MTARSEAAKALAVGDQFEFSNLSAPVAEAWEIFPEVQVAISAATVSATSAIKMAFTMNSLRKVSQGKTVRARLTPEAQDCLRSALLFSGAGLDTALKRLAAEALPSLVATDAAVAKKLADFAEKQISDESGSTSPKELVRLLLGSGETPRDVLVTRWVYSLESNSAQSASRVSEIAGALGVVDAGLRRRVAPNTSRSSLLEKAFVARNEIAHELDVTRPEQGARKQLETIRRYRKLDTIVELCAEVLDVTQDIVNDVATRVDVSRRPSPGLQAP